MAVKYKESLSISENDAKKMAALTDGYPFAFQVLGYLAWNSNSDYKSILPEYKIYLEDYVYDKLWSELSSRDQEIAYGIAQCKSSKIKDIRELLGITTNECNPYRKRLIRKGIINGDEHGVVKFAIPMFKEFVLSQMD